MSLIHESLKKVSHLSEEKRAAPASGSSAPLSDPSEGAFPFAETPLVVESNAALLSSTDVRAPIVGGRPWFFPLIILISTLTIAAFVYAYEHDIRTHAEEKLSSTMNELNDIRFQNSTLARQKTSVEKQIHTQIEGFQTQIRNMANEQDALKREKQALEFENLSKERINTSLVGEMHRIQMNKLHLLNILRNLRTHSASENRAAGSPSEPPSSRPVSY